VLDTIEPARRGRDDRVDHARRCDHRGGRRLERSTVRGRRSSARARS
jgi:hypothetical protein